MPLRFPCEQCGAFLSYEPGTTTLKCPYCSHVQDIPDADGSIDEIDFLTFIQKNPPASVIETEEVLHCNSCAAEFSMGRYGVAGACPFCGSNVVVPTPAVVRISPASLIPFQLNADDARKSFSHWVGTRFWAPNNLKKLAKEEHGLHGVYIPYWTFDAFTVTQYTGMMGITRMEAVRRTDANGNSYTSMEPRTDWYPAAGTVDVSFDDVLVLASNRLPSKFAQAMNSFDLTRLIPYTESYLSGFQAVRYDVELEAGYGKAQQFMQPEIDNAIRYDIGGDKQQILTKSTQYHDVTFKHVLLPLWAGSYRYQGKSWTYLVNAQTGEVQGEAPISIWKVMLAVLLGLIVVGAYFYLTQGR